MTNPQPETKEQANEAYMENYRQMVERLCILARLNTRQFLGTRPEGDPRVDYLAGLESFKYLVNAQISGLTRAVTALLGKKKPQFFQIMEEEVSGQLKAMEDELGVTGWSEDGVPVFDLDKLREKTQGWPA